MGESRPERGLACPFCHFRKGQNVVDSRAGRELEFIRRRRECAKCRRRYTTYEYLEEVPLQVKKRDGSTEEYSRAKLKRSILAVAAKRSPLVTAADEIATEIEYQLIELGEPASSVWIGEQVLEILLKQDEVAAVRFASGQRRFGTPRQFTEFITNVLRARTNPITLKIERGTSRLTRNRQPT